MRLIICFLWIIFNTNMIYAQTKPTEKLVIWHSYRGEERILLDEIIQTLSQDFQIEIEALALPYQAFSNKLQVAIPRGNGPDLLIFAHDKLGDWVNHGLIEPIGYWVKPEDYQDFFPNALDAMTYNQNLYGIPLSCKSLVLYYNQKRIKQVPKTMEALIEIAQKPEFSSQNPRIWGLGIPEVDSFYFHAPWFHAFHGNVDQLLTEPQELLPLIQSTDWLLSLTQEIMPKELTSALLTELFKKDQLLFVINGPWFKGELAGFEDWQVANLPSVQGRESKPFLSVEGLFLSSKSKNKEWAFKIMNAFHQPRFNQRRIALGILTAHQKSIQTNAVHQHWFSVFEQQIQKSIPMSSVPKMKGIWSPIKKYISQMIDGHRENTLIILKQELQQVDP